jgi:hypothetical protein
MRLGELPCGCENRKEIMFTAGKFGLTEAAMLTISVTAIIIAWKVNNA